MPSMSKDKRGSRRVRVSENRGLSSKSQPIPIPTARVPLSRLNGNRGSTAEGIRPNRENLGTTVPDQNTNGNTVNPEGNASNRRNSSASKTQSEYLLICPEFPERCEP
ncbi:unnamed protein product [Echinostoma caproni]|uniref:Uncharacterized protein n=1 Tax=Echinostoma caproni TaxID=27848 RepID=A0A183AVM4_9TREM|nr:unnamed protein product [Echinostoma caproni]